MAFALMPKPGTKTKISATPVRKHKSAHGQRAVDSQPGFGRSVSRSQTAAPVIQAKLKIGEPNDKFEQEADRVAEEAMRMPDSEVSGVSKSSAKIQRKCGACTSGEGLCPQCAEEERIQRKPLASTITPLIQRQSEALEFAEEEGEILPPEKVPSQSPEAHPETETQLNDIKSGGQPLPQSLRAFFEPRFGYDFSQVMVHTGAQAASLARAVNARAFTVGNDIVFGAGQYRPNTPAGHRLIAHELTHALQQGAAASRPMALAPNRTGKQSLQAKPEAIVRILQRQPDDTDRCPPGEIRLGPGLPCIPLILPGRKCPIGQVEFGGSCVSLRQRPTLLGGKLTPPTPPPGLTLPGPTPTGASASGKTARVRRMESLRDCAYTVTYANQQEVDCDTVWRNEKGTNPPGPLCGVSLVYDIVSVSASGSKCPAKVEGLTVSEITQGDHGCTPPDFSWPAGSCTIGPGGKVTGCTDTFTLCGLTRDLKGDCTEIVDQEIEVGGQLAQEHEIIFELKKSDKGCTGKVTRN
jgi:hypothetical protein